MHTPAERLLTAWQLAELLQIEHRTVLARFRAGDIPGFRLYGRKGGPVRFRWPEIETWLAEECAPVRGSEHRIRGTQRSRAGGACGAPAPDTGGAPSVTRIVPLPARD